MGEVIPGRYRGEERRGGCVNEGVWGEVRGGRVPWAGSGSH